MYLIQFIRETQVKYPNISRSPLEVLKHLFFTNGNGYSVKNNEFQTTVVFWRSVDFSSYYKEERSTEDCLEYYDRMYYEQEVAEQVRTFRPMNLNLSKAKNEEPMSDEDFELSIREKLSHRYDKVDWVDNYTLEDLKNEDKYYDMILNAEFNPYLSLSPEFYLAWYLDQDMSQDLKDILTAISIAYIRRMKELLETKDFEGKRPLFGYKFDEKEIERYLETYPKDIKTLDSLIWRKYD